MVYMKVRKKYDGYPVALAMYLFLLSGILSFIGNFVPFKSNFLFLAESFVYTFLLVSWLIHVQRYILSDKIKSLLTILSVLLLFYIFIRACKYNYFTVNGSILRKLWYLYYIPQIYTPFITFCVALRIGKSEDYRLPGFFKYIFILGTLLELLIITNDHHFLAFRFNPDFYNWEIDYRRGPVFVLTAVWIYFFLFSAVILMTYKTRSINKKKYWIPVGWLLLGTVYIILFAYIPILNRYKPYNLPEIQCFIIVAMLESCIRIGLIPSNIRYAEFFSQAGTSVQIANKKNKVIYKSESAIDLTKEQMLQAMQQPFYLDENTLLLSEKVYGGNIFWTNDLSEVNKKNDELHETGESLYEKSKLLMRENEIKTQKAQIAEQNRLYDNISILIKPQLDTIADILKSDESFFKNMVQVCVLNCYIKRRVNLTLLAYEHTEIDIFELYLSIKESLEYIKLKDIIGNISIEGRGTAPASYILLTYDIWENIVEQVFNYTDAILVSLFWNDETLVLKISLEYKREILFPDLLIKDITNNNGKLDITEENNTVFINLEFYKGGEK